jgi:hypothetical protein
VLLQALADKKADILCDINQERVKAASKLGAPVALQTYTTCTRLDLNFITTRRSLARNYMTQ